VGNGNLCSCDHNNRSFGNNLDWQDLRKSKRPKKISKISENEQKSDWLDIDSIRICSSFRRSIFLSDRVH